MRSIALRSLTVEGFIPTLKFGNLIVGVSDRGVLNRLVNLFCVLPILDGDAKRHKVYTGSGN